MPLPIELISVTEDHFIEQQGPDEGDWQEHILSGVTASYPDEFLVTMMGGGWDSAGFSDGPQISYDGGITWHFPNNSLGDINSVGFAVFVTGSNELDGVDIRVKWRFLPTSGLSQARTFAVLKFNGGPVQLVGSANYGTDEAVPLVPSPYNTLAVGFMVRGGGTPSHDWDGDRDASFITAFETDDLFYITDPFPPHDPNETPYEHDSICQYKILGPFEETTWAPKADGSWASLIGILLPVEGGDGWGIV